MPLLPEYLIAIERGLRSCNYDFGYQINYLKWRHKKFYRLYLPYLNRFWVPSCSCLAGTKYLLCRLDSILPEDKFAELICSGSMLHEYVLMGLDVSKGMYQC